MIEKIFMIFIIIFILAIPICITGLIYEQKKCESLGMHWEKVDNSHIPSYICK